MKDDIPDNIVKAILVAISVITWAFIGWTCFKGISYQPNVTNGLEINLERKSTPLILVGGNSLKASVPHSCISPQVLGIMGFGLEIEEAELLNRIIECETGWRNVCNTKYGCNGGQGIAQLIPKTVKTCEKALGKTIDPFDESEALECAAYLLTETKAGKYHWGTPDGWWGSWSCWHSE